MKCQVLTKRFSRLDWRCLCTRLSQFSPRAGRKCCIANDEIYFEPIRPQLLHIMNYQVSNQQFKLLLLFILQYRHSLEYKLIGSNYRKIVDADMERLWTIKSGNCGLKGRKKNLRKTANVPTEIQNWHLSNTSQNRYRLNQTYLSRIHVHFSTRYRAAQGSELSCHEVKKSFPLPQSQDCLIEPPQPLLSNE